MLKVMLPATEEYDDATGKFTVVEKAVEVELEHSLVSVSKWESEFQIAFLGKKEKTQQQITKYVEYMLLHDVPGVDVLARLDNDNVTAIRDYITSQETATRLLEMPGKEKSRETVTSELIYYWMIALNIPWEAQYWHLNRLLTLIDLTQRKNNVGQKKMNKSDMARQRSRMNRARQGGGL